MTPVYTLATWIVCPGKEEAFVEAWQELGRATLTLFPEAHGTLLRDREERNRFVSFGPWESFEQIEAWRGSQEFQESVARIREVLEAFEPRALDLVVEIRG